MATKRQKRSSIFEDAVRSVTKTMTKVYGRAPKKSVVNAVARRLVETIPAPSNVSSTKAQGRTPTADCVVPLAASAPSSGHRLNL
jgi:hypothetical protein